MKGFFRGMLIGVGIGLVVAPMRGQEMRRILSERINEIRDNLSQNDQINQYAQQVSQRFYRPGSDVSDRVQQATERVKSAGSDLGELSQKTTNTFKQTGKGVAESTRQAAKSTSQDG